jgi:hypothetical protein
MMRSLACTIATLLLSAHVALAAGRPIADATAKGKIAQVFKAGVPGVKIRKIELGPVQATQPAGTPHTIRAFTVNATVEQMGLHQKVQRTPVFGNGTIDMQRGLKPGDAVHLIPPAVPQAQPAPTATP